MAAATTSTKSDATAGSPAGQQVTILRIKRKRTEEPLEALLLQQEQDNVIQRNEKRVRKETDVAASKASALSVSATTLPTIFRLAETVEEKSFHSPSEAQKLKDRITRRLQAVHRAQVPESLEERKDKTVEKQMKSSRQARYRVIQQKRGIAAEDRPPTVESAAEKAAKDMFQMYEAVKDEDDTSKKTKLFVDEDEENPDDIMCNFIPMVKEYLTLNEKPEESDDDYVYDVYYQDVTNASAGINAANVGSLVWFNDETEYLNDDSESEAGDYEDEDSNAEDYYQNDYPEEESDLEFEDQYRHDLSSDDDEGYY